MGRNPGKTSILAMVAIAMLAIYLPGCGGDVADKHGCPSGTVVANSDDILNIPADTSVTIPSAFGSPAPAGSGLYILHFNVTSADGTPRNNVCFNLYTGGTIGGETWYADSSFTTTVAGVGPYNAIVVVTDDSGSATLFWEYPYPAANVRNGAVAGVDIVGDSNILFTSGAINALWILDWTVKGEPGS